MIAMLLPQGGSISVISLFSVILCFVILGVKFSPFEAAMISVNRLMLSKVWNGKTPLSLSICITRFVLMISSFLDSSEISIVEDI